jgi:hypothetical protein
MVNSLCSSAAVLVCSFLLSKWAQLTLIGTRTQLSQERAHAHVIPYSHCAYTQYNHMHKRIHSRIHMHLPCSRACTMKKQVLMRICVDLCVLCTANTHGRDRAATGHSWGAELVSARRVAVASWHIRLPPTTGRAVGGCSPVHGAVLGK